MASWQASLEKLKSDGTLQRIQKKYASGLSYEKIPKPSNFSLFMRIAKAQGAEGELTRLARKQSFQFHRFKARRNISLGSSATEAGRSKDEEAHKVSLNLSFEIQQTPVTQLQWSMLMAANPSEFKKDGIEFMNIKMNPNRPVEQVSWLEVQKFIQEINELDAAYRYRLPTEAEWEFAARAGTHTAYSFGDDPKSLGEYGWYSENSGKRTHDVASLKPNPAGLFDMHGNVWEWVSDWYAENSSGGKNTTGPENGTDRVIRGGSWNMAAENLRSARRQKDPANFSSSRIGFRLVRIF